MQALLIRKETRTLRQPICSSHATRVLTGRRVSTYCGYSEFRARSNQASTRARCSSARFSETTVPDCNACTRHQHSRCPRRPEPVRSPTLFTCKNCGNRALSRKRCATVLAHRDHSRGHPRLHAGHDVAFGCNPAMAASVESRRFRVFRMGAHDSGSAERLPLRPRDIAREERDLRERFARTQRDGPAAAARAGGDYQ